MPATPAWPPRSAPRLFVAPSLSVGERRTIEGAQAHYLTKVMRVARADAVVLCDDATGEWAARVVDAGKRSVVLEVIERLRPREAVPDIVLAPALLKKDRFDWLLEKATELGAAEIRPWIARRSMARALNRERAAKLTIEAAEQCARTALPRLAEPVGLEALLDDAGGRTLFYADEEGGEPAAQAFLEAEASMIVTGPEGGFDPDERARLQACAGSRPISLGPRILRGETAAIAALALWMGVAGDWDGGLSG